MFYTRGKKFYVQSESRKMFFLVWDFQSKATELCEFRAKIPAFFRRFAACSTLTLRVASQNSNEKRPQITVSLVVFLVVKMKNISEIGAAVSYIPLSTEKIVESRQNYCNSINEQEAS